MKKGIGTIAMLILGLFGTLVIGGIAFVSLYSRTTVTKRAMMEINVINAINKFELSRIGLSKSLEYSFYEASYLTSPMGGYYKLGSSVDSYDCIPYWRDYSSTKYPGFDYMGKLVLEALKGYVEEIDTEVDIPEYEYSEVEILDDSSVRVQASSGEKLSLKRDRATVEINALETTLTTNIGEMYKTAEENFIENDIIQEKLQEAIDGIAVPKSISVGDICENELDPEAILGANTGSWESDIEDEVERKINELSNDLTNDDVEVGIELLEISVSYEPECSHVSVVEDEPSCCKKTYSVDCDGFSKLESECDGINYCNPYFFSLPTHDIYYGCYCDNETHDPVDQVELCEGCEEYYRYLEDVTCTYNYYASARVLVEIRDASNQFYPVMDADQDVEFKPVVLKFYVLSGNDYDHKIDAVTDSEECEVEVLDLPSSGKPPGHPSPPPYPTPGKTTCDLCAPPPEEIGWSQALRDIYEEAANAYNVPAPLLMSIGFHEWFPTKNIEIYSDDFVEKYSAPKAALPGPDLDDRLNVYKCPAGAPIDGQPYDYRARGIMQFMPNQWNIYKDAVVEAGARPEGYEPNICNIKDAIFASAKKMRHDVETINPDPSKDFCTCAIDVDDIQPGNELPEPVNGETGEVLDFSPEVACADVAPTDCDWSQADILHANCHYSQDERWRYWPTTYWYYQEYKCEEIEVPDSVEIIDYPALASKYDHTRFGKTVDRLVYHYTACSLEITLDELAEKESRKASVHYVLDRDGTIYRLVDEQYSAWHGGCCVYKNYDPINDQFLTGCCYSPERDDCKSFDPTCIEGMNPRSVGIEIVNTGYLCDDQGRADCTDTQITENTRPLRCSTPYITDYWEEYDEAQINSLIKLSTDIIRRNPNILVDREHIIGHDEITCQKHDPGPAFPWDRVIDAIQNELTGPQISDIEELVNSMSADQLVSQLIMSTPGGSSYENYYLFESDIQSGYTPSPIIREDTEIFPLVATDAEGGDVKRLPGDRNPGRTSATEIGRRYEAGEMTLDKVRVHSRQIANEMKQYNLNMNLAPVLDIASNPSALMIGYKERSFSGDPDVATELGEAFMQGLKDEGIIVTGKHFPGYGNQEGNTDTDRVEDDRTLEHLENIDLKPYYELGGELDAIMMNSIIYTNIDPDNPAVFSDELINKARKIFGDDVVLITDSLTGMPGKLSITPEESVKRAITHNDILLFSKQSMADDAHSYIVDMINSGELNEDIIKQKVLRVLRLKQKYGLIKNV